MTRKLRTARICHAHCWIRRRSRVVSALDAPSVRGNTTWPARSFTKRKRIRRHVGRQSSVKLSRREFIGPWIAAKHGPSQRSGGSRDQSPVRRETARRCRGVRWAVRRSLAYLATNLTRAKMTARRCQSSHLQGVRFKRAGRASRPHTPRLWAFRREGIGECGARRRACFKGLRSLAEPPTDSVPLHPNPQPLLPKTSSQSAQRRRVLFSIKIRELDRTAR